MILVARRKLELESALYDASAAAFVRHSS